MSQNTVDERNDGANESGVRLQTDELVCHVERYDRAPDECTIYPPDVSPEELVTSWITAEEGSFVDLSDVR